MCLPLPLHQMSSLTIAAFLSKTHIVLRFLLFCFYSMNIAFISNWHLNHCVSLGHNLQACHLDQADSQYQESNMHQILYTDVRHPSAEKIDGL